MVALTLAMSELVGTVLQSVLYGIYFMLFVGSIYIPVVKHHRRSRSPINKVLLTVSILLFLLISAHWGVQIARLVDAFIVHGHDPNAYYGDPAQVKNVTKTGLYVAQTFVGDFTMVYRLFIVWGRNYKVIILPCLTSFGLLVAGSGVAYSFAHVTPGEDIFNSMAGRWIVSVFATSLSTNMIVTVLIAYKIWTIQRPVKTTSQRSLMPIMAIFLESAAIYTVCLILTHSAYLGKATFQFITLDITSPAIGISFALIIVRVGLGVSSEKGGHKPSMMSSSHPTTTTHRSIPLSNIRVNVDREIVTDIHPDDDLSDWDRGTESKLDPEH